MFTGEKNGSGFGLINPALSPYSKKNPQNPYRGLQGLGAQTIRNPISRPTEGIIYPLHQLAGLADSATGPAVPAMGFSGFGDFLTEAKSFLLSGTGLVLMLGGLAILGHYRGWFKED